MKYAYLCTFGVNKKITTPHSLQIFVVLLLWGSLQMCHLMQYAKTEKDKENGEG